MKFDNVFVIAEIGGNHEGDIDKARKLMRLAIDAGADSVKFQVYTGDTLVNIREDPDRVKHFDRFSLADEDYIALATECIALGADFNASIWNERQINLLDPYMSFYKIGSGDLTAYPLLKAIALKKKPIVLSTGLSNFDEIRQTIKYICSLDEVYLNKSMISILQCTSMYPIPDEDANLNVIRSLQTEFPYSIGYSDHTEGVSAAQYAVALGAKIIEVHFTDDREGKEFRDHKVSFTPDELRSFKTDIKSIITLLGDGKKRPMQSEIDSGHRISFRRGLYPAHDIHVGDKIKESDLLALRPMHGVCSSNLNAIVGKTACRDILKLSVLDVNDFE
jgi:N-acetylneuraminate synthase/N,N'-diacetyllegionaminate synthase